MQSISYTTHVLNILSFWLLFKLFAFKLYIFRHAEDLFGELARDAQQLYDRSNSLQARIDRLAIKVTQLDSTVEEVSLQDIHMRKAFKSAVVFDQQVKTTLVLSIVSMYMFDFSDILKSDDAYSDVRNLQVL